MKATTPTRKDGLFGFNANTTDFNTIRIENNVIEISAENPRPLMRNEASYGAHIFNNNLKNVSDTDKYENPKTDAKVGPLEPLVFRCGVNGEYIVEGWNTSRAGIQ